MTKKISQSDKKPKLPKVPDGVPVFRTSVSSNVTRANQAERRCELFNVRCNLNCGYVTEVAQRVNESVFTHYECKGCRRMAPFVPPVHPVTLFGDESARSGMCLYGLVSLRNEFVQDVRQEIHEMFERTLGTKQTLKSTLLFNPDAKRKSVWASIDNDEIWEAVFQAFTIAGRGVFSIGVARQEWIPRSVRNLDGSEFNIEMNQFYIDTFTAAINMLVECGLIRRDGKTKLIVDQSTEKIEQLGMRKRSSQGVFFKDLYVMNRLQRDEDPLLALPDLLIWAYGKTLLEPTNDTVFARCLELVRMCNPYISHCFWANPVNMKRPPDPPGVWNPEVIRDGRDLEAIANFVGDEVY